MESAKCFTCVGRSNEKQSDDVVHQVKKRKKLSTNLDGRNTKLGEVLRFMGVPVGREDSWGKHACCTDCRRLAEKWYTAKIKVEGYSQEWLERTGKRLPTLERTNYRPFKTQAIQLIQESRYGQCVKLLRKSSDRFEKEWFLELKKIIHKEIMQLAKTKNLFPSSIKEKSTFTWDDVVQRIASIAPTIYAVFEQTLVKGLKSTMDDSEKRLMGIMLLIPAHHRRPLIHKFLPSLLSSWMWRCGTKTKVINAMRGLGVSQTVKTVRRDNGKLAEENDQILQTWCETIKTECTEREDADSQQAELHPSYALVIGHMQWNSRVAHVGGRKKDKKNRELNLCNGYAAKNRVSFRHLEEDNVTPASEIPIAQILPTQDDYDSMKGRMCVIVERILVENLTCFQDVPVVEHIPHQYSEECARKSECVNLGVIEENPLSTGGMIKILSELKSKVPKGFQIPMHGNQKTVEMVNDAKVACSTLLSNDFRFTEFLPVPQEFHLRSLVVKDTIDEFYSTTKAGESGTLKQLRNMFAHLGVNETMTNFDRTDNFLLLVCCLFVVGFALDHLKMKSCDDIPPATPTGRAGKKKVLQDTAEEIVHRVWNQTPMNNIRDIISATVEGYLDEVCICKGVKSQDMIECSNLSCERGRWFHRSCVRMPQGQEEEEWFCSAACIESGQTAFCICRTQREEPPSLSCANEDCPRGRKFHEKCVASRALGTTNGKWYCSFQCLELNESISYVTENMDRLLLYVEACTWRCLLNEALRDAVREGDGRGMMSHWRILFPELYRKKHASYVPVTHRLLTGIAGCFPERVREEVVHNRTVNLSGGAGENIGLDLGQEYQNDKLKECIRLTNGRFNKHAVQKVGKISGEVWEEMEEAVMSSFGGTEPPKRRKITSRYERYTSEVRSFFGRPETPNLFSYEAGREVPSLMNVDPSKFSNDLSCEDAEEMKAKIVSLNEMIDTEFQLYAPLNEEES